MPLINLNQCSARNLTNIPGIEKQLADAIVKYRHTHGSYRYFDEIWKISRMTRAAYRLLRLHVEVPGELPQKVGSRLPYEKLSLSDATKSSSKSCNGPVQLFSINTKHTQGQTVRKKSPACKSRDRKRLASAPNDRSHRDKNNKTSNKASLSQSDTHKNKPNSPNDTSIEKQHIPYPPTVAPPPKSSKQKPAYNRQTGSQRQMKDEEDCQHTTSPSNAMFVVKTNCPHIQNPYVSVEAQESDNQLNLDCVFKDGYQLPASILFRFQPWPMGRNYDNEANDFIRIPTDDYGLENTADVERENIEHGVDYHSTNDKPGCDDSDIERPHRPFRNQPAQAAYCDKDKTRGDAQNEFSSADATRGTSTLTATHALNAANLRRHTSQSADKQKLESIKAWIECVRSANVDQRRPQLQQTEGPKPLLSRRQASRYYKDAKSAAAANNRTDDGNRKPRVSYHSPTHKDGRQESPDKTRKSDEFRRKGKHQPTTRPPPAKPGGSRDYDETVHYRGSLRPSAAEREPSEASIEQQHRGRGVKAASHPASDKRPISSDSSSGLGLKVTKLPQHNRDHRHSHDPKSGQLYKDDYMNLSKKKLKYLTVDEFDKYKMRSSQRSKAKGSHRTKKDRHYNDNCSVM